MKQATAQVEETRKTVRDDIQVLVVVTEGPEKGKKFEVKYLEITLGRKGDTPTYDVEFDDQYISGSAGAHATMILSGSNIYIQDNNSTNGTMVDGEPCTHGNFEEIVPRKSVVQLGKQTQFKIDIRKRAKS